MGLSKDHLPTFVQRLSHRGYAQTSRGRIGGTRLTTPADTLGAPLTIGTTMRITYILAGLALVSACAPDEINHPLLPTAPSLAVGCREAVTQLNAQYGVALIQRMDVYRPAACGPVPVVVFIHGGGWWQGDKSSMPTNLVASAAARGMAVATINYRLSTTDKWPAQSRDTRAALAWLRANAGRLRLDTTRIALWGASAGGHLAAYAGMTDRVHSVITWFAPINFDTEDAALVANGYAPRAFVPGSQEARLLGVASLANASPAARWNASPLSVLRAGPRWRIEHGRQDSTVPWQQATELAAAVGKASLHLRTGGHGGSGQPWRADSTVRRALEWLRNGW